MPLNLSHAQWLMYILMSLSMLLPLNSVVAKTKVMASAELKQKVIATVKKSLEGSSQEIAAVKPPPLSPIRLQDGATLEIIIAGEIRNGMLPVEITVKQQDRILRKQRSFVKIEYMVTVIALTQSLSAGQKLSRASVTEIKKPSSQVPRDALRDIEQIDGAVLRRGISANVPIRSSWITTPKLVKRGAIVDLIFKRGGIFLSARGEALGDGKKSDMIRVKNLKSKKIVTGRVIGINQVDVGR